MIEKSYQSVNHMNHSSNICAGNRKARRGPVKALRL